MQWCESARHLTAARELGDGIVEWALQHVTDGLFVDGGACVGMFCIPVLLQRLEACCVAFEPNSATCDALQEMAELNGVSDRLTVLQMALYDYAGLLQLKVPVSEIQAGLCTLGTPCRFADWRTHQAEAIQLDSLELAPQLIKLDLEGAELFALCGAVGTITQHRPAMIVEAYAPNTRQFEYEPSEIGKFLEALGYNCQRGREDLFCTI